MPPRDPRRVTGDARLDAGTDSVESDRHRARECMEHREASLGFWIEPGRLDRIKQRGDRRGDPGRVAGVDPTWGCGIRNLESVSGGCKRRGVGGVVVIKLPVAPRGSFEPGAWRRLRSKGEPAAGCSAVGGLMAILVRETDGATLATPVCEDTAVG